MVKIKEPAIGEDCRTIHIDGFSDFVNPKRVRLAFYSIRMGMPEKEGNDQILQLARETECVMDKDIFLKFAERIASIKQWIDEHPHEDLGMDKNELKRYVAEHFTSDELTAIWLGHEIKFSDSVPIGLLPLFPDDEN